MSGDFPTEGMELTHLLVVRDLERSRAFYVEPVCFGGAEYHQVETTVRMTSPPSLGALRRDLSAWPAH